MLVASIAREKVAVTAALVATEDPPAAGCVDVTVGGEPGAAVVKLQLTAAASGVPPDDATVLASAAV
jgi:hypothetical protein